MNEYVKIRLETYHKLQQAEQELNEIKLCKEEEDLEKIYEEDIKPLEDKLDLCYNSLVEYEKFLKTPFKEFKNLFDITQIQNIEEIFNYWKKWKQQ